MKIPLIGLGTWNLRGKECTQAVKHALEIGYRHIDTAHVYENHDAIKQGIHGWKREDLFITSKIALEQIDFDQIEHSIDAACNRALKELGTEYIDLYLLHWPDHTKPLHKIFKAMERLVQKKKVLYVGVSNFTIHHLEDLLKEGCNPSANQVEFHPYLYQKELLNFCEKHKTRLIAYRPLGKGKLLSEALVNKIGEKHQKNAAQILLRWLIQKEIPAIPKAGSEEHLRENLQVFDFTLSPPEMKQLDELNCNQRFCGPDDKEFSY